MDPDEAAETQVKPLGAPLRFDATLSTLETAVVVRLPRGPSSRLPSRGQVAVHGRLNRAEFDTVLEPDGNSGHWMRIPDQLQRAAGVGSGDRATLEIFVARDWPEPVVPPDLSAALAAAPSALRELWADISPMARWEWVRWLNATSNPVTRQRRVEASISKLESGKRRPCCFNLSACTDPSLSRSGRLIEPGNVGINGRRGARRTAG
jgi:hypothetical protein